MILSRVWLLALVIGWVVPASAQDVWKTTKTKMTGDTGYSLSYDYEGEEGAYKFRYAVQGDGSKILTEVLQGSARGAGSKILFDPAADPNHVQVKTSMLTLRRSLGSSDIKDSSLYQPLFRQLVEGLVEPEPREILPGRDRTVLVFGPKTGSQDRIEVDGDGNPLSFRHLEKGREIKKMTFRNLTWGQPQIVWP